MGRVSPSRSSRSSCLTSFRPSCPLSSRRRPCRCRPDLLPCSAMAMNPSPEEWSPTDPAMELAPGFWRLPMPIPGHTLGGVCAFLVRDADGYVMIDSGMDIPSCVGAMEGHLAGLGVPTSALHTIVATHCHPDHLGQAARLRALSDARVWLHALDAPLVDPVHPSGDADVPAMVECLRQYGFPPDEAAEARQSVDPGQGASSLMEPDRLL